MFRRGGLGLRPVLDHAPNGLRQIVRPHDRNGIIRSDFSQDGLVLLGFREPYGLMIFRTPVRRCRKQARKSDPPTHVFPSPTSNEKQCAAWLFPAGSGVRRRTWALRGKRAAEEAQRSVLDDGYAGLRRDRSGDALYTEFPFSTLSMLHIREYEFTKRAITEVKPADRRFVLVNRIAPCHQIVM